MQKLPRYVIPAIEPALGAIFLALWIVAEAGRQPNVVVFVAFGVAIGLSRAVPIVALSVLGVVEVGMVVGAVRALSSTDWPAYLAIVFVIALIAFHGTTRTRFAALGAGLLLGVAAAGLMGFSADNWASWTGQQGGVPFFGQPAFFGAQDAAFAQLATAAVVLVAFGWVAGFAGKVGLRLRYGTRIQDLLKTRVEESEAELARAEERTRIAQEMHDVLAHSLAVIVAQADGARFLRSKRPAAVDGALTAIADSARSALVDVNGIIDGMFDGVAPPQPGLDDIDDLVGGVEAAGLGVSLTQAGEPRELAPGQELTVYRIVQEGFTNALRHRGRGSTIAVVLDWRGLGLSLQLVSTGAGDVTSAEDGSRPRRGIEGMRERARLAGGWLAAGLDESGDHRLTAFVPYRASSAVREVEALAVAE